MSQEEIEIYRRLMKERSAKGGKKAWKGKSKAERKRIMSERQKKRWAKAKAETQTTEPDRTLTDQPLEESQNDGETRIPQGN